MATQLNPAKTQQSPEDTRLETNSTFTFPQKVKNWKVKGSGLSQAMKDLPAEAEEFMTLNLRTNAFNEKHRSESQLQVIKRRSLCYSTTMRWAHLDMERN